MAVYSYRCTGPACPTPHPFDVRRPIGTADPATPCPACGGEAVRVFTPPLLGLADRGRLSLIDTTEKTRWEPGVVAAPPAAPRSRGRVTADPRHRTLPRP